jgi:hypothetical protein
MLELTPIFVLSNTIQHAQTREIVKFSHIQIKERRFRRLAEIIYDHWEEGSGMDTRFFSHPFINDVFVVIGQSAEGGNYREHVVPRVYLRDKCLEMFSNKATIEDVAKILLENLLIVKITKEQADELNSTLKIAMPDGWVLGKSDPLERLYRVGIKIA